MASPFSNFYTGSGDGFGADPFRVTPAMDATAYKTYSIRAPRSTHSRKATCAEVGCPNHENGWVTRVDEATELGARQAGYIRRMSGRKFAEGRDEAGLTEFVFPPGQKCFAEHFVPLDREPQYLVLGGDWRGNPRGDAPVVHRTFDDWANDFGDHQDRLRKAAE